MFGLTKKGIFVGKVGAFCLRAQDAVCGALSLILRQHSRGRGIRQSKGIFSEMTKNGGKLIEKVELLKRDKIPGDLQVTDFQRVK